MRIPVYEDIAGTTVRTTWVNSGVIPDSILSTLKDSTENVLENVAGVNSGNGFYFALHHLPLSAGWYVNEWFAVIQANTYVKRQFIRGVHPEV